MRSSLSPLYGREDFVDLTDGEWHMITVTSHRDDTRGYVIYIDGIQRADLSAGAKRTTLNASDANIQVFTETWGAWKYCDTLGALRYLPHPSWNR